MPILANLMQNTFFLKFFFTNVFPLHQKQIANKSSFLYFSLKDVLHAFDETEKYSEKFSFWAVERRL